MAKASQSNLSLGKLISLSLLCGISFGALIAFVGFIVVGMGHGWGMPSQLSIFAPLICSLAAFRFFGIKHRLSTRQDIIGTWIICGLFILPLCLWAVVDSGLDPSLLPVLAIVLFAFVVYAVLRSVLKSKRAGLIFGDVLLLAIGLWSDVMLYKSAVSDEAFGYRGDAFEHIWLTLWAVWQVIVLVGLVRKLRSFSLNGNAAPQPAEL